MTNQFIAHIKLAEMRATAEGHDLLVKMMQSPGMVVTVDELSEDSLIESIKEGGGKVWWCGECDSLCSPKRPCVCRSQIQKSIVVSKSHDADDPDKITIVLSQEEFGHVLRAMKFCRHIKSKTTTNAIDKKWIESLSKMIDEIGES